MLVLALTLICVVVLHVAGPFPTFFRLDLVSRITARMVVLCAAHAIVEETLLRHVFWSHVSPRARVDHAASLVWLNVLAFWLLHVLILYRSDQQENREAMRVYRSTSYNLSVVFFALMLNAVYLETRRAPLLTCIAVHFAVLMAWTVGLGAAGDAFYDKYQPPSVVRRLADLTSGALSDTKRALLTADSPRAARR